MYIYSMYVLILYGILLSGDGGFQAHLHLALNRALLPEGVLRLRAETSHLRPTYQIRWKLG